MQYLVGLDLGQTTDYTALCVLEQSQCPDPAVRDRPGAAYLCRHLERIALGTPYTSIVQHVARLVEREPLRGCPICIDQTGVGRPVVDMFRQARVPGWIIPVTITGGAGWRQEADGSFHVAKRELVSCLQVLLGQRRLRCVASLPEAATLTRELQGFQVKVSASGNEQFGAWRESVKDDIVLAISIAAWFGERSAVGWDGNLGGERGVSQVAKAPRGVFGGSSPIPSPW